MKRQFLETIELCEVKNHKIIAVKGYGKAKDFKR